MGLVQGLVRGLGVQFRGLWVSWFRGSGVSELRIRIEGLGCCSCVLCFWGLRKWASQRDLGPEPYKTLSPKAASLHGVDIRSCFRRRRRRRTTDTTIVVGVDLDVPEHSLRPKP